MTHRITLALLALLTAFATPAAASAHGAEPLPENLHGFESGDWVFHVNFGIITSDDTTRYVCEEAFSGGERFRVAPLGLHEWVIFTADAIYRTEDGCDFEKVEALPKIPSDADSLPGASVVAYTVNTDSAETTGVFVSEDAGATFRKLDIEVAQRQFTRVEVIDAQTVLVSAYSKDAEAQGQAELLEVSLAEDSVSSLEVTDGLKYPYLLDVNADAIVWQASTDRGQSLFWGTVAEPTRDEFPLSAWPNGVALSRDGTEFWIAAANTGNKGLTHATSADMMVDIAADHSGLCVGRAADSVYACASDEREGHELSRVVGADIEPAVSFEDIAGPRTSCPEGSDVATTCPAVWPELAQSLGIEVEDGNDDGDEDGDDGDDDGGGGDEGVCSSVGGHAPSGVHLFLASLVIVALFRARRRCI